MRGNSLWLGLAALWICVAMAGTAFLVLPEPEGATVPVSEADVAAELAEAPDDPLALSPAPATPEQPEVVEDPQPVTPDIPTETEPEPEQPRDTSRTSVVIDSSSSSQPASYEDVTVTTGGTLTLATGEVSVSGDFRNDGTVHATATTLVFDGADQTLSGAVTAKKVVLRGGTKRIRGSFGTTHGGDAQPGQAGLYVEAGTTLIIEKDGKWTTPNPYGFQIAGNLVIDGGEFHCRFSNGNGTDRGEESWLPGSTLTINSGRFVGGGDADFSGATINIYDGALEINDDIWNTGDTLNIFGGSMRNTTGGGMFHMTGTVNVRGGKLQVYQNSGRSLRVGKDAAVYCTGGEISINGSNAAGEGSGILLLNSATLPDLVINADTTIHKDSTEGVYLSVSGNMSIAKGRTFNAAGRQVICNFTPGDESGQFIP